MRSAAFYLAISTLVANVVTGCGEDTQPAPAAEPTLSQLGLFSDVVKQTPADGVIPYDVISVLYADNAQKLRFLNIPSGASATYEGDDPWDYPDGTRIVKTFYYANDLRDPSKGRRLIETRVLEQEGGKWTARTYVWNDAQTDATRLTTGTRVAVSWIDESGKNQSLEYRVPNENQCASCHARNHIVAPLGPRTRQLNRDHDYGQGPENQIDHFAKLGILKGDIPPASQRLTLSDPEGTDPIDKRARSYLEANCSHCHRSGGNAGASGLDLEITTTDPLDLGICREPTAAGPGSGGHVDDIVPGDPADSIMVFRVSSTDPELKMPQLPTVTSDPQGVALITQWIASMPPMSCE